MAEFPDITSKLNAPSKKSQFERQKAEAEAKKARERAETLAVLGEFEKSFDVDDDRHEYRPEPRGAGAPAPGKRHFTSTGLKSGPGSLPRSGPGSLGAAYTKKRPFEDYNERRESRGPFQPDRSTSRDVEERDEEKAAKPTLHLASMPLTISAAEIKQLFTSSPLTVDNVRILPPNAPTGPVSERKSASAIVTLAAETPASDIDTLVSHLQNKYLGYGFKLSISRHLSSAAISTAAVSLGSSTALPFGARPVQQHTSLSRAPPPNQRFAPPQSYTSSTPYARGPPTQINVQAPSDLKQLKLIHKTIEALLTYGPEFEALLMSRSQIQRDERWSWLWDSSSVGGVYYRWRLWEILTNATGEDRRGNGRSQFLFEGQSAWQPPDNGLRFEYTTQLDEFVSDNDYNSSDEESDGEGGGLARRYNDHNTSGTTQEDGAGEDMGYLDPLAKAKLTHLLSRLPDSSAKLRRGDVARITAFAIEHAGAGGDEVAVLITRNVLHPFCKPDADDKTAASMVALYVISDILSCSANAGVRHAWRYRTLFEQALRQQKVFEKLGRAERDLKWGKLKGEKWKRSVQNLLTLWEGWSVFPQASHEKLADGFLNPPLTDEEQRAIAETEAQKRLDDEKAENKAINRWRTVDEENPADVSMDDVDGTPMSDDEAEDVMSGLENIDGVSMADSSDEEPPLTHEAGSPMIMESVPKEPVKKSTLAPNTLSTPSISLSKQTGARRQRPKAADMFADTSD